ncbi:hypothetical protein T492DRAFT_1044895 [Pavlovales sp. CCMP2436]|nr:hypothetical protein T492DRAFT_1044895 [Pavlovales sp. CCMP2436]
MAVVHCVADEARDEFDSVLRVRQPLVALHRRVQQLVRVRRGAEVIPRDSARWVRFVQLDEALPSWELALLRREVCVRRAHRATANLIVPVELRHTTAVIYRPLQLLIAGCAVVLEHHPSCLATARVALVHLAHTVLCPRKKSARSSDERLRG